MSGDPPPTAGFPPARVAILYRRLDLHTKEILRGATTALALKVLGAVLAFAFNVLLARLLGAENTGIYLLALTIVTIAATVGRVGLDNTVVRFVAAHASVREWEAVRGVWFKAVRVALASSAVLAVVVAVSAPLLARHVFSEAALTSPLRFMSLAVVPLAMLTLHAQALQGLKRVRDAITVLSVLTPLLSCLAVLVLAPRWGVQGAVGAYVIAAVVTMLFGMGRWRALTMHLRKTRGAFDTRVLLASSLPLFLVALCNLVVNWASILALGAWATARDVGIFGTASRTALLISFVLIAVNAIAAPKFAAMYQQGDMTALARTARGSAKMMTLAAGPVMLLFVFAGGWVMRIFGSQFAEGGILLAILAVGQFVNVSTGSVGYLLMMTGNERLLSVVLVGAAGLSLALNLGLVPVWGATGAAIATAVTLGCQNLVAAALVWRRLGIVTLPGAARWARRSDSFAP